MGVRHPPQKKERKKHTAPRKISLYLGLISSGSDEVIHVSWFMNTEG